MSSSLEQEMKTHCQKCGKRIGADQYSCALKCTFCRQCAEGYKGFCPNCGGELLPSAAQENAEEPPAPPPHIESTILRERIWVVCLASLGIWSFLALSASVSMYEFDRSLGRPADRTQELILPVLNFLIFAFLTPFVFFLARSHPIQKNKWPSQVLLYGLGGILFSVVHVALRGLLYPVWDPRMNGFTSVWNYGAHGFQIKWILLERLLFYNMVDDIASVYTAIVLIAHAVWYYKKFRERELRASQLETQLAKARLKALKSQMQPHFLFNTLHSISALILTDVSAADKMITRLGGFLRISLDNDEIQFTTLNRELEFVNGYLEIEKVRFEDRLNLVFNIQTETRDALIPHLLLQPLIENAIRHGISRRIDGGTLEISTLHDGARLHIQIKDDGPGFHALDRKQLNGGFGVRATRERLQTIYGDDHIFDIRSPDTGGVEVDIWIPFRSEPRLTSGDAGTSTTLALEYQP